MGASTSDAVFAPVVAFGATMVVIVGAAGAAIASTTALRVHDRLPRSGRWAHRPSLIPGRRCRPGSPRWARLGMVTSPVGVECGTLHRRLGTNRGLASSRTAREGH